MKKLFTLVIALFALAICAKAQVAVFSETFDAGMPSGWTQIDANNDGYGWEHCSNPVSYFAAGADLSGSGHNSSTGFVLSGSYSNVTSSAITPDNWLITPTITLTSNSTLSFYVSAQDANYAAEHYGVYITTGAGTSTSDFTLLFEETIDNNGGSRTQGAWKQKTYNLATYTGQTVRIAFRHFNCNDEFVLNLDDVEILAQPTTPTIVATPNSINFGNVLIGDSASNQVAIAAYSLTAGITANASTPFAVSADGTTYGSTATVAQNGGTLYVLYAPTAANTDNDMVILSSTGVSDTIMVTGTGLDCSNITIPFTEGFESTIDCWTMVSMDPANDSRFGVYADASAYAGSNDFRFSSFSSATDYNQYLITPELTLNANETYAVSFYYKGYRATDNFKVLYSTTNNNLSSFIELADYNSDVATSWTQAAHILPAGTKYVAINYYGDYQYYLFVDEFSIQTMTSGPSVTVSGPTRLMAGATGTFSAYSPLATSFAWEVDGVAATSTTDTLTYIFTTAGIHNVKAIASNNFGSAADSMDVDIFTCDAITSFPFTETFDETSTTLECWEVVDANNDGYTFEIEGGEAIYSYNSDEAANDYLISPELTLTSGLYGHIDYAAASANYPEKLSVYVIPANGTIANAVNIVPTMTITNDEVATLPFDLSAYANQTIRVAFKAESDADMYDLSLSNFVVEALPTTATINVDPTSMSFTTEVGNTSRKQAANVSAFVLTNDITVSTTAPFEVSLDGTTYGATATIPAGNVITATLYVRYAPTAPGTQTGAITLTSGSTTASISLTGEGIDCSAGIASLPFTHDFNDAVIPPFCWGYANEESFLRLNVDADAGDYGIAIGQPDYLMTPEIHTSVPMVFSFDYATYVGSYASSTFRVGYSSTNNISNFTWLAPVTVAEDIEGFEHYSANIPSTAKYIAIQATEIGEFQYFFTYTNYIFLDNITIAEGTGIENFSEDNVSIYPNPANNVVNVNAASNINNVEIFNMMGQKVAAFDANDTNVQINTTALSNGMYMMRITTENGVSNQKFTVAR